MGFIKNSMNITNGVESGEHHLLLVWLTLTGLILFGVFVCLSEDVVMPLYTTDRSYISLAITMIYILVTFHCAGRIYSLSHESNQVNDICAYIHNNPCVSLTVGDNKLQISGYGPVPNSLMSSYLHDLVLQHEHQSQQNNDDSNASRDLIEVYAAKLKGPQEIGWFTTDIMLKLGLLGTIIGFIMMLGSVTNVTEYDVTTMQKVLKLMSYGMGTALYTTLAGLIGSILAATQYYMMDRSADKMLESMQHISEVRLKPALAQDNPH